MNILNMIWWLEHLIDKYDLTQMELRKVRAIRAWINVHSAKWHVNHSTAAEAQVISEAKEELKDRWEQLSSCPRRMSAFLHHNMEVAGEVATNLAPFSAWEIDQLRGNVVIATEMFKSAKLQYAESDTEDNYQLMEEWKQLMLAAIQDWNEEEVAERLGESVDQVHEWKETWRAINADERDAIALEMETANAEESE